MKRGTTNPELKKLVIELKNTKKEIWKRVAEKLEKPARNKKGVNLWKINKYTKEGETVVVPGKVLSIGDLEHSVNIAAYDFSDRAKEKIKTKGKAMTISELVKENPKGSKVKIMV